MSKNVPLWAHAAPTKINRILPVFSSEPGRQITFLGVILHNRAAWAPKREKLFPQQTCSLAQMTWGALCHTGKHSCPVFQKLHAGVCVLEVSTVFTLSLKHLPSLKNTKSQERNLKKNNVAFRKEKNSRDLKPFQISWIRRVKGILSHFP